MVPDREFDLDYDPAWLIALVRQQYPDEKELTEKLAQCTKAYMTKDLEGTVYVFRRGETYAETVSVGDAKLNLDAEIDIGESGNVIRVYVQEIENLSLTTGR